MAKLRSHNDGTNLIVNYLPQTVDGDELNTLFSECGMIEAVNIIRDSKTQISRGFAFVKFVDKQSADAAIKKYTGYTMGRKTLRVSLARPAGEETKNANLIMENLPLSMTDEQLLERFSVYGKIVTHRLLKADKGRCRGKAYVRFNTKSEADDAILGLNGINIGGEGDLIVKFADPPVIKATPELLKKKQTRLMTHPYPLPARRDPYLTQPYEYDIPMAATGPMSRPPFARFGQHRGPGPMLRGRSEMAGISHPIRMHTFSPSPFSEFGATPNIHAETSYLSDDPNRIPENHRSSYDPDNGWSVFVYGIPHTSTDETLYQLFSQFGAINTVKRIVDRQNRCRGFGFVHMMNYDDAYRSTQVLGGAAYEGKRLQVRFKNDK